MSRISVQRVSRYSRQVFRYPVLKYSAEREYWQRVEGYAGNSIRFEQGAKLYTGLSCDFAIDGDGFFAVSGQDGGIFYTEAAVFQYPPRARTVIWLQPKGCTCWMKI